MGAIRQLNNEVRREIDRLSEGEMGEVLFDERMFCELPDWELYQEPPPDVIPKPEDEEEMQRLRVRYPFLLGMYIPMSSPGQVILFGRNLRAFFWSLVRSINSRVPFMTKGDLHEAWEIVMMKTHEHELFHYNINVLQELFGGTYVPEIEEALAVAWARHKITGGRWHRRGMNGQFHSLLMERAFAYNSPGYRDWVLYADEARFKPALLEYISPNNYAGLQANGVDMQQVIFEMIGRMDRGYVERVW